MGRKASADVVAKQRAFEKAFVERQEKAIEEMDRVALTRQEDINRYRTAMIPFAQHTFVKGSGGGKGANSKD